MPMLPSSPAQPSSYTHTSSTTQSQGQNSSALSRLANLVGAGSHAKHHLPLTAAQHARHSSSGEQSTSHYSQSQAHSRTQSDESDWYAAHYSTLPLSATISRRGHESSSGEEREREMDARGRRRESVRGMGGHPYAAAGAMAQAGYATYLQPEPSQPQQPSAHHHHQPHLHQSQLLPLPPPHQHQHPHVLHSHHRPTPLQLSSAGAPPPTSFAAEDPSDPSIAQTPPRPLQPSKSAGAVARFRAVAAKHNLPTTSSLPISSSSSTPSYHPAPFYSTTAPNSLPASTLTVLASATRDQRVQPPLLTPPGPGGGEGGVEGFGYATVYPPVRVSLPLSPPRENVRLSAAGGVAGGGHPYAPYAPASPTTARRVRSSGSLLSSYQTSLPPSTAAVATQPLSPTRPTPQHFTAPSFPSHPFAPSTTTGSTLPHPQPTAPRPLRSQPSLTTVLAASQLDVPPFRVPPAGHPYALAGPGAGSGRDRSQTVVMSTAVPTHWRHQSLRPSASAYDLRPGAGVGDRAGAGGAPRQQQQQQQVESKGTIFPRLLTSRSHTRLKPSASIPNLQSTHPTHEKQASRSGSGKRSAGEGSGTTGHQAQSLQVMTACDALVFPRPRLRPHAISPPESPGESPLFASTEWTRPQGEKTTDSRDSDQPQPPRSRPAHPPSAYLQRVIEEGAQRDRERVEWAAAAERGLFVRRRAKSVPRSRVPRSSRGGGSDTEGGVGSWWSGRGNSGEQAQGGLSRGPSTGSRVLRKGSVQRREREERESQRPENRVRAESTPTPTVGLLPPMGVHGHRRGASGGSAASTGVAGAGRNGSLRERVLVPRAEREVEREPEPRQLTRREQRRREEENIPVIDIRPPTEPRRSLQEDSNVRMLQTRPRARTSPPRTSPPHPPPSQPPALQPPNSDAQAHLALHGSLPPSPTPPIGVALSTPPLLHPHIPHPYAAAFGATSSTELDMEVAPAPAPHALTAGPHPSAPAPVPAHQRGPSDDMDVVDISRRHRMPPRAGPPAFHPPPPPPPPAPSVAHHPYASAASDTQHVPRKRVPRKPVPSYPPAVPPMLTSALEETDDGRKFMASIDDAGNDPVSREATPKPDRRRGHYLWDLETERALLIAAGLNPSPSPGTAEEKRFSQAVGQALEAQPMRTPPLDESLRRPSPPEVRNSEGDTTEPESGFVTAPETPFGVSRETLGEISGSPPLPVPGSIYMHGSARSAHTVASSSVLPLGRNDSQLTPRLPSTPVSPASPYSGQRAASKRTMSAWSRESSPQVDLPPPLGGLDQIEAQMFKDLWTPQEEDIDQSQLERDMERQLEEARQARAEARREREREREMALRVEVVGDEFDGEPQDDSNGDLPDLSLQMTEGHLLEPHSKTTSRRPSGASRSEGVETPLSAYSDGPEDDVRVGHVGHVQVPQPTQTLIRHLSIPLSILDSDGTEIASNDPFSPPARAISLSPSEQQQLSLPSSAFVPDFAHRHSHMTGVSMVTSYTSGNERMSGLLSDFPQPPEDPVAVNPSSVHQSYYTPASELDDYPVQIRLGESPMVQGQSLQQSEADDSPSSKGSMDGMGLHRGQN